MARRIIMWGQAVQMRGRANVLGNPYFPNLGKTAEALDLITRAIGLFQELERLDPNDRSNTAEVVGAYRCKAALLEDTQPAEAVDLCRAALPADPGAHAQIAHPLRKLGRTQEALQEVAAAMAAPLPDEDAIWARIELGDLRREQGDHEAAAAAYRQGLAIAEKAVARKPYVMRLRKELADCYERLGMWDKSLAVWNEWTRWGVSSSYDQKRKRQAEKMLVR